MCRHKSGGISKRYKVNKNREFFSSLITFPLSSIHPELELQRYNLNDNDKIVYTGIINHGTSEGTIGDAVNFLNYVYTKHLSAEFMHLEVNYKSYVINLKSIIIIIDRGGIRMVFESFRTFSKRRS